MKSNWKFVTIFGSAFGIIAGVIALSTIYLTDVVLAEEVGLKKGEIITLHIGKPTQVATKRKNRNAIFTYTGKVRSYYTIDYQSCDGRSGTGTQSYCNPHKIFLHQDNLIEIDIYLFKIMPCDDRCSTLLSLEFIQYK